MGWALIKAVSLAYLLGAVSLSVASLAWWIVRGTIAPQTARTARVQRAAAILPSAKPGAQRSDCRRV